MTPEPLTGLTAAEAARRLAAFGPNELPHGRSRSLPRILKEILAEPMFALLLGSGVIYLLLGDKLEACLLLVFASISTVIAVVQEARSERVLEALRDLTSPRALVIRDGTRARIPGREVVPGDLLVLAEGDRVPADARLIEAREVSADESLLTGESVPVPKHTGTGVFSGTLIVRGHGVAEAHATGPHSEIGRIGRDLEAIEPAPPRLKQQTGRMVRIAAMMGAACCLVVVILYAMLRGSLLNALLAGIALGMAMLPEEFPLVLTVFLVMGAWRISRARVLTRRAAAIETLGEATVLCTDKTGTLTENYMSVAMLQIGEERMDANAASAPAHFRALAQTAAMASAPNAWDPMDRAFRDLIQRWGGEVPGPEFVRVYGQEPELMAFTWVWRIAEGQPLTVAAKGAPEAIALLCRLPSAEREGLLRAADRLAESGMRVLAVAEAQYPDSPDLPATPHDFAFRLLGLAGIADPLRATVPEAVRECRTAGVRVVMITGDYPITARAIARQAGIESGDVLDGPAIALMSDAELREAVRRVSVFARIVPAQKLRIVLALKAAGDIVAMTGDGVNDAPALKAADIGIAMGSRGTDVAREAASLVLLDDDFGSIVRTIRLGRRIYDNLRKAMAYIIAIHVPIAGLALMPLVLGMPLIFGPVHIAFLEMVIDPVCSMVFEAERPEEDVMKRRPRGATSPLFSTSLIVWSTLQGTIAFAALAFTYWFALKRGFPEGDARAMTFVGLVATGLALVLINRSFGRLALNSNRALLWVSAVTISMLTLVLALPAARDLFRFGALHADDLAMVAAVIGSVLIVLEFTKRFWRVRLAG
jgi:Ca2+-transporting ATPase